MINSAISVSSTEEIDWLNKQIDQFNEGQLNYRGNPQYALSFNIKDENKIIAGINCILYLDEIFYIDVLFVDQAYRGNKLGSLLLKHAEDEARKRGAQLIHLDTFDFQGKDFYLKYGYTIFGVLDDCPKGHKRYYLKKQLK